MFISHVPGIELITTRISSFCLIRQVYYTLGLFHIKHKSALVCVLCSSLFSNLAFLISDIVYHDSCWLCNELLFLLIWKDL